jgi:sugar lactone lactonase YvrE
VTDRIAVPDGRKAYACTLGGRDRRTLYGCVASSHNAEKTAVARDGRIVAVTVDVPGAGLP